ncbi:MAG TPA: acyl-CoA desaturase [Gemmataceae bacterium]|nr:acyl-CoA desaturase [Gemmataceae bacterium]
MLWFPSFGFSSMHPARLQARTARTVRPPGRRHARKPAGAPITWQVRLRLQKAATWASTVAFVLMHVACLAVFLSGTNVLALSLCAACYLLQMLGITAGYHRYFAHRAYKTSRIFQFVLAWLGCSAVQRGPLWWAAQHRHHHRTSDTPEDLHSPVAHNLWWSHVGWVLSRESDGTDEKAVRDLGRYPELRRLDRYHWLPPLALAGLCLLVGGWSGLVWGFFIASVLSYHATFLVNSACHLWGRRRYATPDASRNNLLVALLTLGEGWHNNHHHYQSSANQGFFWWEVDVTYYLIRGLAGLGLVWDVRTPPRTKRLGTLSALPGTLIPAPAPSPTSDTPPSQAFAGPATWPERMLLGQSPSAPSQECVREGLKNV